MRYQSKKLANMIDELSTYCLERHSKHIKLELEERSDRILINVEASELEISEPELEKLKKLLNSHREVELEEYYWALAGEGHHGDELGLVASMVDCAEIYVENNILYIKLVRLKKHQV